MKLIGNFVKLCSILALQAWTVKATDTGRTVVDQQDDANQLLRGTSRELQTGGCCSWNVPHCGSTTDWCNASKDNCERYCRGTYITSTPPSPSPNRCGCSGCTSSVLDRYAGDYKVVARIDWLKNYRSYSEAQACGLVCGTEFPNVCSECNPGTCNNNPTPTPPSPSPPSGNRGRATTTRYWDCSGGSCGCGYTPEGKSTPAHCPSNALFNAPRGNRYGARFYGTAAISASLGGGDWLTGCGKCFKVTGTSNVGGDRRTTTLVLKSANFCPNGNPQCAAGPHFDIAAPGFDFTASSLSNNCNNLFGSEGARPFSECERWPDSNCNCWVFQDPTLREGCENFKSLNWNNPVVDYEEVTCPAELARLNCWEKNDRKWPSFFDIPQFCANN